MKLVIDIENTVQYPYGDSEKDGSPYNPNNRLVSVGYHNLDTDEKDVLLFNHIEYQGGTSSNTKYLQMLLDEADLIIGHNLKHDMAWLYECGFIYDREFHDTMMFEYVFMKGMKRGLSLSDCLIRRGINTTKTDALEKYLWKHANDVERVNTDAIPLDLLTEYNLNDVVVTGLLYKSQLEYVEQHRDKFSYAVDTDKMVSAVKLMTDFLPCLIDMERMGTQIDLDELDRYKKEFSIELNQLNEQLAVRISELMGDTPFSMSSNDDMARLFYSRFPTNKVEWCDRFNIGTEQRGAVKKKKKLKRLDPKRFGDAVNDMQVIYKTLAEQCPTCKGTGKLVKINKDGSLHKRPPHCPTCKGVGVYYKPTTQVAGLKLRPRNDFASQSGFATSRPVIEFYLSQRNLSEEVKSFLTTLDRRNKLDTWVNQFIASLEKYNKRGKIHTSFNQCITATGRLSSTRPNLQNQPKRNEDFPIRRVFIPSFEDGYLVDADFGQLEFRIAAYLSQCPYAIKAVEEGLDVHSLTMNFYHGKLEYKPSVLVPDMTRQEAKADTFGPLYGKITDWTSQFYALFPGIETWHQRLMSDAATNKMIQTPSGRVYAFPDCDWYQRRDGQLLVSSHTQIKNYCVQGFATGDVVLLVCMDIWKYLKQHNAKSKLILQVHDSATTDTHPQEKQLVWDAYQYSFGNVYAHAKERWGIDLNIPLAFDLSIGKNWLEQETWKLSA